MRKFYKLKLISYKRMPKKLGVIQNISSSGNFIVQSKFAPSIGSIAIDKTTKEVGKIINVFGNVKKPYVSVRPFNRKKTLKLLNKEIYIR